MIVMLPVEGLPEVREGTDLGQLLSQHLAAHGPTLQAGDVVVVTQKIVSKAEGCFVDLAGVAPSPAASELAIAVGKDPRLVELVLRESLAVVRTAPNVVIARHRLGHIMANAGLDASNFGAGREDWVLLDAMVIHGNDDAPSGLQCPRTDTVMRSADDRLHVAQAVLDLAAQVET